MSGTRRESVGGGSDRRARWPAAVLALGACVSGNASAHDFWIEPATFRPAVNELVTIGLKVGDDFQGDPYARNPSHIREFVLAGPGAASAVPGWPGADPAGFIRITRPGPHLIGYLSTHTLLELSAERFEASLKREGLEHIVRLRAATGESDRPATEAFFRCAKALLAAGEGGDQGYDRVLGFPLELVPERNPYRLQPGGVLPLRVLYLGKPIADVLIVGRNAADRELAVTARSDADGRVSLTLERAGMWLIKGVHMVAAPPGLEADWESAWASLTFELPAAR